MKLILKRGMERLVKSKIVIIFLSLVMLVNMIPASTIPAKAVEDQSDMEQNTDIETDVSANDPVVIETDVSANEPTAEEIKNSSDIMVTADKVSRDNVSLSEEKVQVIRYKNSSLETSINYTDTISGNDVIPLDFSAEASKDGTEFSSDNITYKVENNSIDDTTNIDSIAEINNDGQLKIKNSGFTIKVIANVAADGEYGAASIERGLTIVNNQVSDLLSFEKDNDTPIDYVLGTNNGVVSDQTAVKKHGDDNGEITYTASCDAEAGLSIDEKSGKLEVSDYTKLGNALEAGGGSIDVKVTASKSAGTKTANAWGEKDAEEVTVYAACSVSYMVKIRFAEVGNNPYSLYDFEGNLLTGPNGNDLWFKTAVTVKPANGYYISKNLDSLDGFSDSVIFDEQGEQNRKIYLRDSNGGITEPIIIDALKKIDSEKPGNISIQYSTSVKDSFLEEITFGFYRAPVTITFTAHDNTSGIRNFVWNYTRTLEVNASDVTGNDLYPAAYDGILPAVQDDKDKTKYTASLTLPADRAKQLKGNLSVYAEDLAGLISDTKTDTGHIIVVDTVSPELTVSYACEENNGVHTAEAEGTHYYSGEVKVTFDVIEVNFFPEDIHVYIAKDGGTRQEIELIWNETSKMNQHEAVYTLQGDGDYIVSVDYVDRSDNKLNYRDSFLKNGTASYISEMIIIDTEAPVVDFIYESSIRETSIRITDHSFKADNVTVADCKAKDITGTEIGDITKKNIEAVLQNENNWTHNGDVHTIVLSDKLQDGIYELTIACKDYVENEKTANVTEITVDHTAPAAADMEIIYSTPLTSRIIEKLTLGYYKPDVKVTFAAKDFTSGIDYFTWSYTQQEGTSNVNAASYADAGLTAVQDTVDPSRFTATVTLPKETAEQLRGSVAFTATDKSGNTSEKVTDSGNIIVVDTIAATMTAEYTTPSRTVGNQMYYNKDVTAVFNITEANFYAEDVIVEFSRNGADYTIITPVWSKIFTDVHTGVYTIAARNDHSNDGDYIFRVTYMDRSGNAMAVYTSNTITVDTLKPVINVSYANTNAINTFTDTEGHTRKCYGETQTATVTVTEHNFSDGDIKFSIVAKDLNGGILNADALNSKSGWSTSGDEHKMTITYPGDANYTFDLTYVDLATNEADDFQEEYFTVDKTAPDNLSISYSTSTLETVLNAVTFGFYEASATVTVSAQDTISPVHGFKYSYQPAADVSPVNTGVTDQVIEGEAIVYDNGRMNATAVFNIPQSALGEGTQFNGNVSFTATDDAGNESELLTDGKRIIVDNISPTANVEYNAPVQTVDGIAYYDGTITATITINEANFYSEDVQVSVTRDGVENVVNPSWSDNSTDVHVGTFEMAEDGDYLVTIGYTDKSSNQMAVYTSEQMTLDTEIEEPVITINGVDGNGKAFKDNVVPAVRFHDVNFEDYEISLTRTRYYEIGMDVTEDFLGTGISIDGEGGEGSFDTFPKTQEIDGIYTLTVSITDRAGHAAETSAIFTVNRFGSVYVYDNYLISLIENGGAYVQAVTDDLVITEYNADRLVKDSLDIEVSQDGRPLSDVQYVVSSEINDMTSIGDSGWYQYRYTIDSSNFAADGVYKISVSSKDATGNQPETTNYENQTILFRVDSTAPEINSITGLEESIVNATGITADYTVYDTIGLASVSVYVNGVEIDSITDFADDLNNYSGSFALEEKSAAQTVRLVVTDLAGNETDTDSAEFVSAYVFNKAVTVSTNFLVRWYADKVAFWGTICGVAAVIVTVAGTIILMKKRRSAKKE